MYIFTKEEAVFQMIELLYGTYYTHFKKLELQMTSRTTYFNKFM